MKENIRPFVQKLRPFVLEFIVNQATIPAIQDRIDATTTATGNIRLHSIFHYFSLPWFECLHSHILFHHVVNSMYFGSP